MLKSIRDKKDVIVQLYSVDVETQLPLPLISENISAGFPSPAMDFIDLTIDLNKYVVRHPSSTFFGRIKGHSMKNSGIFDGDLIVIDKSIKPKSNQIAVCYIDGDFTIKRILIEKERCLLIPANEDYEPIEITTDSDFLVWGIVTHVLKTL